MSRSRHFSDSNSSSEEIRDAVVTHFLERRSHAEIARDKGISRQAVTLRIQKGVRRTRTEHPTRDYILRSM